MQAPILGTASLFAFFFKQLPLLRSLDERIRDPYVLHAELDRLQRDDTALQQKSSPATTLDVRVPARLVQQYNDASAALARRLRCLHAGGGGAASQRSFDATSWLLIAVRCVAVVCAFVGASPFVTAAVSALQFLAAPYSFFVAVTQAIALAPELIVG
jgi:hypothetical protein